MNFPLRRTLAAGALALGIPAGGSAAAVLPAGVQDGGAALVAVEESGGRGWLGIHVQNLTASLKEALEVDEDGVLVSDVGEDSPAARAGLEAQDVILSLDGRRVAEVADLMERLAERSPGEVVRLGILRDAREREVRVRLGEAPPELPESPAEPFALEDEDPFAVPDDLMVQREIRRERPRLGVSVVEPDENLAGYFDVAPGRGVLVTRVHEGTPAEKAGLRSGDVILSVDGRPTTTVRALQEALREAAGKEVALAIVRRGNELEIQAELERETPPRTIRRRLRMAPRSPERFWRREPSPGYREFREREEELRRELQRHMGELRRRLLELRGDLRRDLDERVDGLREELKELERRLKELEETVRR